MATPPRKKLKSQEVPSSNESTHKPQGLFAPFRALGFVTNHVPFAMQVRSSKGSAALPRIHILTSVGKSWTMWEGGKMGLLFVGPEMPEPITSLALDGDFVWATHGSTLSKYHRGKLVTSISNPIGSSIYSITVFGSRLVALTEDGRHLLVWNGTTYALESTITFENGFTATHIHHPATYLNKILVASAEGGLQLWNISTQTCIFKFNPSLLHDSPTTSAITALVQSPAIDVVGIGFASGEVSVYDIRADERLLRFHMEGGSIKSLSFRTDGHPVLATASSAGHIAFWDLNAGGRILHIARGAHDGVIVSLQWIPGQPVLASSGEDNSVKQWLFDSPTSPPRLLKFRSGHHSPPHLIRYYGDDGKQILTAARDRSLRFTSVVRDSRSFELSQGSLSKKASSLSIPITNLKFPPINSLSFSSTRSKDWEDVLTTHTDELCARTWSVQNKKAGRWTFKLPDQPPVLESKKKKREILNSPLTTKASTVTACGNFGLAGFSNGSIQMWNMQSGIARRSFDLSAIPTELSGSVHSVTSKAKIVTGLATDALNKYVIASTLSGTLSFFNFHSAKLETLLVLPSPITSLTLQRDSGLLAAICDDLTIRIVDVETKRIVRELCGFKGRILDQTISPDSRWLISTSLDSIIRTFDIPTGRLIDAFRTPSVATSITFSPTGDFLASAHIDSVGVYLWANRAQFGEVSLKTIDADDDEIPETELPAFHETVEDEDLEAVASIAAHEAAEINDVYATPAQLDEELVTLTLLPRSKWQTLLNIETVQQRNKPKEPPRPPEKAPFFLPTLPGVEQRFDLSSLTNQRQGQQIDNRSRNEKTSIALKSDFVLRMEKEADQENGDFEIFFKHLKSLSPAALDLEIRSLSQIWTPLFLRALTNRLKSHRDFEAVQTLISVFLRIHGELFTSGEEDSRRQLEELLMTQETEAERVTELLSSTLGILSFIRNTV